MFHSVCINNFLLFCLVYIRSCPDIAYISMSTSATKAKKPTKRKRTGIHPSTRLLGRLLGHEKLAYSAKRKMMDYISKCMDDGCDLSDKDHRYLLDAYNEDHDKVLYDLLCKSLLLFFFFLIIFV